MSASGRLRALKLDPLRQGTYEQMLDQVLAQTTPLLNALPEIISVVEAAEAEYKNSNLVNDEAILLGHALAVLEEVLP